MSRSLKAKQHGSGIRVAIIGASSDDAISTAIIHAMQHQGRTHLIQPIDGGESMPRHMPEEDIRLDLLLREIDVPHFIPTPLIDFNHPNYLQFPMLTDEAMCQHKLCPECHGTGQSAQGLCIHNLYCGCPSCTPR